MFSCLCCTEPWPLPTWPSSWPLPFSSHSVDLRKFHMKKWRTKLKYVQAESASSKVFLNLAQPANLLHERRWVGLLVCTRSSYLCQINWNQRPENLKKLRRKSSSEDDEVNGSWHHANQSFVSLFNYDVVSAFGLSLNLIGVEHSSLIKVCFLLTGWCTNYLSAHR